MSGIFGIISKNQRPIEQHQIEKMLDALKHRGPDGKQIKQDNGMVFGHLLLHVTPDSIYDKQPLGYERWIITADARLDNRKELFKWLSIPSVQQAEVPDSMLIIKAYAKWGENCPKYLVGDFAFAIWDKVSKSLFCAKDHVGVRQLFYADTPEYFVFSTEVRAIVLSGIVTYKLNLIHFKRYLVNIDPEGSEAVETFVEDIKRILPANLILWENGKLNIKQYWYRDDGLRIRFRDKRDYGIALRELIQQAIKDRIRTDFQVGITLSGGLDSTSIACLAARDLAESGRSLYSASSVLPESYIGIEKDEREYIDLVLAQEKNIKAKFVSGVGLKLFGDLSSTFDKTYEPVNEFMYMDKALLNSLTPHSRVVLSGYGGDITVSNKSGLVLSHLVKTFQFRKSLRVLRELKKIDKRSYLAVIQNSIIAPLLPADMLNLLVKIKGNSKSKTYNISDCAVNNSFVSEQTVLEWQKLLKKRRWDRLNHFSGIWDMASFLWFAGEYNLAAYHNQEHCYPFLDKRIIEFLWASPAEVFLYKGFKRGYLRRAMEGILPTDILWRKDKTPYVPDYLEKLFHEKDYCLEVLNKEREGPFTQFINFNYLAKKTSELHLSEERYGFDDYAFDVVSRGFHALHFLQWHKNINI